MKHLMCLNSGGNYHYQYTEKMDFQTILTLITGALGISVVTSLLRPRGRLRFILRGLQLSLAKQELESFKIIEDLSKQLTLLHAELIKTQDALHDVQEENRKLRGEIHLLKEQLKITNEQ